MSTCTNESMTNHHGTGFFTQIAETIHTWRQRHQQRRELANWNDRDLHDVRQLPRGYHLATLPRSRPPYAFALRHPGCDRRTHRALTQIKLGAAVTAYHAQGSACPSGQFRSIPPEIYRGREQWKIFADNFGSAARCPPNGIGSWQLPCLLCSSSLWAYRLQAYCTEQATADGG